jgi:HEAT repeat protein
MKSLVTIFAFLCSFSAHAIDIKSDVKTELSKIVVEQDMKENARSVNRLIRLGEPAVDELIVALSNPKSDVKVRWAAAQALGEIGSKLALNALDDCSTKDNGWLTSLCINSTMIINGEKERAGKVYLYEIGVHTVRIDVETDERKIMN